MSFLIHHPLELVCLLLVAVGIRISFRNRNPKWSSEIELTVMQLAATMILMTAIAADVPFGSWSTVDWIVGGFIATSLLSVAFSFGRAYEMRGQKKTGAGDAQRVGTGFSPR